MKLLKKINGLFATPVSDGADLQNKILCEELPFKVHEYKTGREHNGWIIPQKWSVQKAEIRHNGRLIYDGTQHPLGVIGSSESFNGRVSLDELKQHLFYKKDAPDNIVYHCDLYYKPYLKQWGFSIPYALFLKLKPGDYDVELTTQHTDGVMKVLTYTHKGKDSETIIFNAHNCHAAQLNDGPAGYAVFIEVMKRLRERRTRYNYRLVIAPEHIGTIFYLADLPKREIKTFKYGMFMEMVGHSNPQFALQESFTGKSLIDTIANHVLRHKSRGYWRDDFRKIVGNDETVWEAPGIEVPMISLSRCTSKAMYYPQYHLDSDTIDIIQESQLEETVLMVMAMIDIFEKNCFLSRKFTGLIALSNPKYNLYRKPGTDPSMQEGAEPESVRWNYLMDCIPRYFDGRTSILDIALKHDIPFDRLYEYLAQFKAKGLIDFIYES